MTTWLIAMRLRYQSLMFMGKAKMLWQKISWFIWWMVYSFKCFKMNGFFLDALYKQRLSVLLLMFITNSLVLFYKLISRDHHSWLTHDCYFPIMWMDLFVCRALFLLDTYFKQGRILRIPMFREGMPKFLRNLTTHSLSDMEKDLAFISLN